MSLIPKCPVENPCEAETFEEAFQKNLARFMFERQESASLYEDMKRDGDPHAETVDPEFWRGCMEATELAQKIYAEEILTLRERVAERLAALPPVRGALPYRQGFESQKATAIQALRKDDPRRIVWW